MIGALRAEAMGAGNAGPLTLGSRMAGTKAHTSEGWGREQATGPGLGGRTPARSSLAAGDGTHTQANQWVVASDTQTLVVRWPFTPSALFPG